MGLVREPGLVPEQVAVLVQEQEEAVAVLVQEQEADLLARVAAEVAVLEVKVRVLAVEMGLVRAEVLESVQELQQVLVPELG